jgi:oxygen-independent coproporphyrinogen-3 oxidase
MTHTLYCDTELLQRYDVRGPRYTSYPTATSFDPSFDTDALRRYIEHSNRAAPARPLSIYVHVPYCFSPCFYCGCSRIITRDSSRAQDYLQQLEQEIRILGPLFERNRPVVQLHLGGGTPNFMRPQQLAALLECIAEHFDLHSTLERDVSIEIDPRYIDPQDIAAYADMGFNRASLGVQDFDPEVQRSVNRLQSVEQTRSVIDACRRHNLGSVNIDLIYGLPKQTPRGFERTLDTVLEMRPERLAIYSYAHLPKMFKAQRQIDAAQLPNPGDKLALLQLAIAKLTAAGYLYIGMDHFALPQDELARAQAAGTLQRNFMGYTTHAECDLLGIGMSAISHIGNSFSQNPRELPRWQAAVSAGQLPAWRGRHLDADDILRAEIIQRLMCLGRIDIAAVETRFDIDFASYFAADLARLQPLIEDGLAQCDATHVAVTDRGRLLVRLLAMCFDRYLHAASAAPTQFSRVV